MKKNIFAVCDLEVDYALNFMDYLNHKKNIPFEIQAFTNVESLIAYGKMKDVYKRQSLKCDGICCMADNCTADCAGEFPAPKRIRIITGDCCNSNTIQ